MTLRRSKPLTRKTRMRRVSVKRRSLNEVRADLRRIVLEEQPLCAFPACMQQATDVHEVLTRGRGGSAYDRENTQGLCRHHHDWVHAHPQEALDLGLLRKATSDTYEIEMSDALWEVLLVIHEHTKERGIPPTIREIAAARGHTSTNGVHEHLEKLIKRGMVAVESGRARAIRLLVEPAESGEVTRE